MAARPQSRPVRGCRLLQGWEGHQLGEGGLLWLRAISKRDQPRVRSCLHVQLPLRRTHLGAKEKTWATSTEPRPRRHRAWGDFKLCFGAYQRNNDLFMKSHVLRAHHLWLLTSYPLTIKPKKWLHIWDFQGLNFWILSSCCSYICQHVNNNYKVK